MGDDARAIRTGRRACTCRRSSATRRSRRRWSAWASSIARRGDFEALAKLIERRVRLLKPMLPDQPELRGELAGMHEELGRLWSEPPLTGRGKRALENFHRALEYDPESAYAMYNARVSSSRRRARGRRPSPSTRRSCGSSKIQCAGSRSSATRRRRGGRREISPGATPCARARPAERRPRSGAGARIRVVDPRPACRRASRCRIARARSGRRAPGASGRVVRRRARSRLRRARRSMPRRGTLAAFNCTVTTRARPVTRKTWPRACTPICRRARTGAEAADARAAAWRRATRRWGSWRTPSPCSSRSPRTAIRRRWPSWASCKRG